MSQAPPEQPNAQPKPELAQRLGAAHVGLREDLEVNRHLSNGQPYYVIRDPLTLKCNQLNQKDYQILTHITISQTLAEVFETLVKDGILKPSEENGFYRFVVMLHQLAFLNLPISDDKTLYKRYRARQRARLQEKLLGFLFLRIPLFDPDMFLDKTVNLVRWLYSTWFFFVWVSLIIAGTSIAVIKSEELFQPLSQMFNAQNMLILWFTLILLKLFHEFGHAYACKVFGGQVPEMGIFLIVMTPCAYVDVTSSWGFTRKWHRIVVGMGGMYIESIVAVIALMVWSLSTGSAAKQIAHNVFFLASVATVVMNINPLMRFDGYYIISDILEIPNLRQRSQRYVLQTLKKLFLGVPIPGRPISKKLAVILFVFGIAASAYRATVILSIATVIAMKAFIVGIGLAAFYILKELVRTVRNLTNYLWKAQECAHVRTRAVALSIILLTIIPAAFFTVPVPNSLHLLGQLARENEHVIHARQDGFVQEVFARPGQNVQPQQTLLKLENFNVSGQYYETQAGVRKADLELAAAPWQSSNQSLKKQRQAAAQAVHTEMTVRKQNLDHLEIKPETAGQLVMSLDQRDTGRYVKRGTPLATVVSGHWVVKTLASEQDITNAQSYLGQSAQFRLTAQPEISLTGTIVKISPQAQKEINLPALTTLGQGEIAIDPHTKQLATPYYEITIQLDNLEKHDPKNFRYGMTGNVKLTAPTRPLGIALTHKVKRFLNELNRE